MSNEIQYTTGSENSEHFLRLEEKKIDAGFMGKVFGSTDWAAASIAWVLIFVLLLAGVATSFIECKITSKDYWNIAMPTITLALGYLFGKSGK